MLPRLRRRLFHFLPRFRYFLLGALAGIFLLVFWQMAPPFFIFLKNFSLGTSIFWSVVTKEPLNLKESHGRTNILLLGRPGGNHEGANLTDTLIFASLDLKSYDVVLVSLPRDIWVDSLKSKINAAYEFGEEKKPGGGLILTKAVVSDILGQPIHYAASIDFSSFTKIVDFLGGLEIEVEANFDDTKYPIEGKENDFCDGDPEYQCRYEHLHFDKGLELMDGQRLLKYVRSRQAEGEEGTDFARAARQRKVLLALKTKLFARETLLNPGKLLALQKFFGQSMVTDIPASEIDDFLKLAQKLDTAQIKTLVLDTGDKERTGFLVNPPLWEYNGAWILVPRAGNWQEIQRYLGSQLYPQVN